ncbi:MAG: nicotinate (nicotinamide) nucleotide adenylyltransferase [Clostridia bacterium]|nr:nicotinate (nicotinamide) nucleotide adenylyltransferase [Clostridia bacterium]
MKIGILGGTFNPPHKGHVKLGLDFAKKLELDKIIVIPAKIPTHKKAEGLVGGRDRLKMCSLEFKDSIFEVSDIEIKSERESYTVYTLEMLKEKYPDGEFYLIIGSDMFLIFDKWYRFEDILSMCTVCVEVRENGESVETLEKYAKKHLGIDTRKSEKIIINPVKPFPVSSTEIRQRIRDGRGVKRLIGSDVAQYIKSRGLYLG